MDAKFFRVRTQPDYYSPAANPVDIRTCGERQELPAPDSRFPGWAAPMSDARLVTNYKPHCAANIPVGQQFPTRVWMQQNASEIIDYSRKVYAERTGANIPFDDTVVPPPAEVVTCRPAECTRVVTEAPGGIGVERGASAAPDLFGTFSFASGTGAATPLRSPIMTARSEGGRNAVRGVF